MPNALRVLSLQIQELWRHFGPYQKTGIICGLLVTISLMVSMLFWSSRPEFRLLYSSLSLKDAAAIQEKLDEERIKYRLRNSGSSIYVPSSDVYNARLLLATEGFPKDTTAGFELFEEPKFGLTDFAQKINYQRALQGELEKNDCSYG